MTTTTAMSAQPIAKPSFIALLIAVSAVSPLGINMYLPSMPGMARALGVDFSTVQLTLSLYLAAMAIGQLIIGPLSDRETQNSVVRMTSRMRRSFRYRYVLIASACVACATPAVGARSSRPSSSAATASPSRDRAPVAGRRRGARPSGPVRP